MNTLESYITNAINNGEPLELEQLNWQAITDNWSCDTLCSIIDKLDSIENVKRVENSIMKLKGYGKISPPDRFINELTNRCIFRYAAMEWEQRRGVSSSVNNSKAEPTETVELANNTFSIPQYLTESKAEQMLRKLEKTQGFSNKKVLDRTVTPWVVSSMPDWGKAAQIIQGKLSVNMCWDDWAKLIGKTGKALKRAANKSTCTKSQDRIITALNRL